MPDPQFPSLWCLLLLLPIVAHAVRPSAAQAEAQRIRTSDGVELFVEVRGRGTPCLYIHGGPGSGGYWLQKLSGDMLERRFQMIYLDQRGTARSTSPADGNYFMDRMVRDFEEVRAALGIKQWITLGHSFGGILQMGYSQRQPRVIKGMVMLNCGLSLRESFTAAIPKACQLLGQTDPARYTDGSIPLLKGIEELYGKLRAKDLFWQMMYASARSKQLMDATFSDIPDWNHDFERIALEIEDYWPDFKPSTRDLGMPVLFFYGKTDWAVGPECFKGVSFPRMILWASDVGHVPFIEAKADLESAIDAYQKKYRL